MPASIPVSRERFQRALSAGRFVLTEGSIVERLRRNSGLPLDPEVAHAHLLYTAAGRAALTALWREYLDIAHQASLPILLETPTWRAQPERLIRAGLPPVEQIAHDAVLLLSNLRNEYGAFARNIFIGGLIGCQGDAYRPEEALATAEAEAYHRPLAGALAAAGADFLLAATLPALSEAEGMARAMASTGCPYLVSFVLRPTGTLLDGNPVSAAIRQIDAAAAPPPHAYLANCVHPAHFECAMEAACAQEATTAARLIGLQGNTSRKSPEVLDSAATLDTDDPDEFATICARLRMRFGSRILGGCCGTDGRHIAAIARRCTDLIGCAVS